MTIFEKSVAGRKAFSLPDQGIPEQELDIPDHLLRKEKANLPEASELDLVRHYTELEAKNHSVDKGFYPLGSCTMKYNPKLNEDMAALFRYLHPYQPEETIQGALKLMYELKQLLLEITGTDDMTLIPSAGAHGELTGMLIIRAYHLSRDDTKRDKVIVPDSAHGTNPASATMAGFKVIELKSSSEGLIDISELEKHLDETVAAIMLTNPNTLGYFERDILKIAEMAHGVGALLYYDGANLNAIMGKARPGDMGFDVVHLNLHKTFSTPHGMGGPGSGPIGVKEHLKDFLPVPVVRKDGDRYFFDYNVPKTIGRIRAFYGNFGVLVKAYSYILTMGKDGLSRASELAVLNANYLKALLRNVYPVAYDPDGKRPCMHEFVADGSKLLKETGIKTLDVAKRLLDYGFHAPTIYFPLIVSEALMIEPTETESKQTLDAFAQAMKEIVKEAHENPEALKQAPTKTPVRRLDEATASRKPTVRWHPQKAV